MSLSFASKKQLIGNDPALVAARYDKLAPWMDFLERFLCSPKGFRERALRRLHLPPGGRALIVGCGGGPEIPIVRNFVGAIGHVDAIDISPKQIENAMMLCARHGWKNISLQAINAMEFMPATRYDAIVFGFSYIAMSPHHRDIARHLWEWVVPGGYMGAMENKLPSWLKFTEPFFQVYVNCTYLGDIRIDPRLDFEEFGPSDNYDEVFGSHCMATVQKG
jgi:ubiquinone/menaquinone biosynthesis C-methylase UbiE